MKKEYWLEELKKCESIKNNNSLLGNELKKLYKQNKILKKLLFIKRCSRRYWDNEYVLDQYDPLVDWYVYYNV